MRIYIIVLISLFFLTYSFGQSFQYIENSPYDIQIANLEDSSNVAFKYIFHDEDQDGDLDLVLAGLSESDTTSIKFLYNLNYFIEYQDNIGSKAFPSYDTREKKYDSFEFPTGGSFMIPAGGDLNNDGLIDFIVSAETDIYDIQYLQFQIQNPDGSFTVTNCLDWGLDEFPAYSFFIPELTDLDSDGDLDILMSGYYRVYSSLGEPSEELVYLYAKNTGTSSNPKFIGWYKNPYGLNPLNQGLLTSGDLDLDGDIDLLNFEIIDDVSVISYIENIGTSNPKFADPIVSPFGLPTGTEGENFLFPSLVDIDSDGDLDLFLPVSGEDNFELRYFENNDCLPQSVFLVAEDMKLVTFGSNSNTYTWINCDNNETLFIGNEPTYTPLSSGSYKVIIKDPIGCISESECVDLIVSNTMEIDIGNEINLYPIPSSGIVNLDYPRDVYLSNVELYNMEGDLLSFDYAIGDKYLNLTSFSSGIYFVKLTLGHKEYLKKIVIVK